MMRNGSSLTLLRRRTTIQGNVRVGGRTLVIIAREEDDNVQVGGKTLVIIAKEEDDNTR